MNELELIDIHIKNWIKIVFIISTIHVLIARIKLGLRFQYFLAFWNIHRYFYFVSGKRISSPININFVSLRVITTSFLIHYFFDPDTFFDDNELVNFLYWNLTIVTLIFLKFFIEKLLSHIFNYNKRFNEINEYRIGIKNLFSIHLFFFLFLIFFSNVSIEILRQILIFFFFIYQLLFYRFIFKKNKVRTIKGLVYFILYLCTFEIVPIIGILYLLK